MEAKKGVLQKEKSQEAQLKKIVKECVISVVVGSVLLILSFSMNIFLSTMQQNQLETSKYLNQYRSGSKTLTYSVQSYAVTGSQKYYDAY